MASAIVADGFLYGLSHYGQGRLFCLDPGNGKVLLAVTAPNRTLCHLPVFSGTCIDSLHPRASDRLQGLPKAFRPVHHALSKHSTWAAPVLLKDGILVKDAETLSLWTFRYRQTRSVHYFLLSFPVYLPSSF